MRTVLAITLLGFTAVGRPSAAEALATNVSCGAVITTDTTLHRNLANCPNNGIVIGADNITLNLNGHTIDGDGALIAECPDGEACDVGVDNGAGHSGVTIAHGAITDFGYGIGVLGASDNRVRDLAVSRSHLVGILVFGSTHTLVAENSAVSNGLTTDQAGLVVNESDDNTIRDNVLRSNGDIGLFMDQSSRNVIAANTITDNPEAGMSVFGDDNKINRNNVRRNGDGIIVTGDRNSINDNHVADAFGCPDGCGAGISFEGGSDNHLVHNTIVRALDGIRVNAFRPAVGTVVRNNVVRDAGVDGIAIATDGFFPVNETLLERNRTVRAADDGIDVDNPSTTLRNNVAVENGDLGIEAVAGVTDAGRNRAARNGNPVQCTNVACTR